MNAKTLFTLTFTLITLATYHNAHSMAAHEAMPLDLSSETLVKGEPAQLIEHQQALFAAMKEGDIEKFGTALKALPSLEFTNDKGETPLLYEVTTDHHKSEDNKLRVIVSRLLGKKANPEAQHPHDSATPLIIAARHNNLNAIKRLLEFKADIDARDDNEETAMLIATRHAISNNDPDHLDMLHHLLTHNGSTDCRALGDGDTTLLLAVKHRSIPTADALLNHRNRSFIFDLHNNGRNLIDVRDHHYYTALEIALQYGDAALVKLLVTAGADYTQRGKAGAPIFDAATPAMQQVIRDAEPELIIESEINRLRRAQAKLREAIRSNTIEGVHTAVAQGANVNYAGQHGTAVFLCAPLVQTTACGNQRPEIAEVLIQYKADVNGICDARYTPLIAAIQNGASEVTQLLLDNKANVALGTHTYPLYVAVERGNYDLAQQLIALKAPVNCQWTEHNKKYYSEHAGWTPLHQAIHKKDSKLITLLIDADANPHAQAIQEQTPLTLARELGDDILAIVNTAIDNHEKAKRQAVLDAYYARLTPEAPQAPQGEASPFTKVSEDKSPNRTLFTSSLIATPDTVAKASPVMDEKKDNESDATDITEPGLDKSQWLWVD